MYFVGKDQRKIVGSQDQVLSADGGFDASTEDTDNLEIPMKVGLPLEPLVDMRIVISGGQRVLRLVEYHRITLKDKILL